MSAIYTAMGGEVIDLQGEAAKMVRLPYVKAARRRHRSSRFVPEVTLRYKHKIDGRFNSDRGPYSGHCKVCDEGQIVLSLREVDSATVLMILLHEVCHAVLPSSAWHGRAWQALYRKAANAYFGLDLPLRTQAGHRAPYDLDKEVLAAIYAKRARELSPPLSSAPQALAASDEQWVAQNAWAGHAA